MKVTPEMIEEIKRRDREAGMSPSWEGYVDATQDRRFLLFLFNEWTECAKGCIEYAVHATGSSEETNGLDFEKSLSLLLEIAKFSKEMR